MNILGYKIIKQKTFVKAANTKEDNVNKLYESLVRYFGKDQIVWNRNDFQGIVENGYLFNPDLYAIVNKIISTASKVWWQVYEVKDTKSLQRYKMYQKSQSFEAMQEYQRKSLVPVESHPMLDLLLKPQQGMNATLLDQNMLGFYCLLGNSYLNKVTIAGDKYNSIGELQVLPAYLVKIIFGDSKNIVKAYTIDSWNDVRYNFEPENVYHFKTFNPDYGVGQWMYGAAPSLSNVLTKSNKSYEAAVSLITNLGAMGLLSVGNDDTMSPETAKALKEKYYEEYGGSKNRGKIMIVGQKMDYFNMAQSITDLNLIEGQKEDLLTMCRVMQVDSRIMGHVEGSTFSNMQEARKDFIANRILPLKYMQAECYNDFIMPSFNAAMGKQFYIDVDFDTMPELADDKETLSLRLQNEVKSGIITPAMAAEKLGYQVPTTPEATQLWISNGLKPMKIITTPKE